LGWVDMLPQGNAVGDEQSRPGPTAALATVELTPEKLAAADIHLAVVTTARIQPTRTVPGEIKYDEAKRVPVNAPADGVVLEVKVEPAERVAKDQLLAVLSCPDIGVARDSVDKREAELELARREEGRAVRIENSVVELLNLLKQKPTPEAVEAALEERILGPYREKIVGAY